MTLVQCPNALCEINSIYRRPTKLYAMRKVIVASLISGGRKSKSGFANTVFITDFCQIVFGFGLKYLDLDFIYGLYLYRKTPNKRPLPINAPPPQPRPP